MGQNPREPSWLQFEFPGNGHEVPRGALGALVWGGLLFGFIALLVFLAFIRTVYTDWLWFSNVEYLSVYQTALQWRVLLFVAGTAAFCLFLSLNVFLAYRLSRGEQVLAVPPSVLSFMRRVMLLGVVLFTLLLAAIFGAVASGQWEKVLLFLNTTPFGIADPVSGRDVSFLVFELPFLAWIRGWLLGAVVVTALAVSGVYFLRFSLRGAMFLLTRGVKIHLAVLGALFLFLFTFGYWLDIQRLVFSTQGAVFGATYTDLHARLPALRILMVLATAAGILLVVGAFQKGFQLAIGAAALWIGGSMIIGVFYPALVQRFQVIPNELSKERPYIERNIQLTRYAFGLAQMEELTYPIKSPALSEPMVARNPGIFENIRLWDHRPLKDLLNQIQFFRLYYDFLDVDVDRYVVEGRYRQVMLAARELSPEKLPAEAQSWVNRKLQFTHGFGATMSPVTEFTADGRPLFFLKDIPPIGAMELNRPEIYHGENKESFVVVNSKLPEFDYPTKEDTPVYTRYAGKGGVQLSSALRRLAYAWQFRDFNVFISGEITPESRIQYRRNIQERVQAITPFLRLDPDPYLVVAEGALYWIQDAYTVSSQFPYSQPSEGGVNYMRNSVKIVISAYDGTVDFYIADPQDPVAQAYSKIFPRLFKPLDQMPPSLRTHIRYPEGLFRVQALKYLQYHMTDANVFYNKEDQWSVPQEQFFGASQSVEPYYVIMRLPGEEKEEFVLILPFTPANRPNLVAWLAARADEPHYGELVAFVFPRGLQIDGPSQVEARIDNDPTISQQFTLWGQVGSRVLRGNLLVLPVDDTVIYVEPVYLQSASVSFPELKRVIVADGTKVVMESSLDSSLAAITRGAPTGPVVQPPAGERPPPAPGSTLQQQMKVLAEAFQGMKASLGQLEDALKRLAELAEAGK
ncbi:MAG: UPF0182 family protein [Chloroflexi bacterium]|nr:UPF0182 family protein [Chloroflexota bacterium]